MRNDRSDGIEPYATLEFVVDNSLISRFRQRERQAQRPDLRPGLPHQQTAAEAGADLGVRVTADVLADLLVEDLKAGSAELRKKVPELLQALVQAGQLMVVDEEYRLQTPESASWDAEFKKNFNRIVNDDARIASRDASFSRLIPLVPQRGTIGYVAPPDWPIVDAIRTFYLAGYSSRRES